MPSLLFGSALRSERIGGGRFYCPECGVVRTYTRTRVRRSVSVLGQPLLSMGTAGEHIECAECLATFRPEILAYEAGDATPEVMAEYQRALRRVLALIVAADGVIREPEIDGVREVFEAVTGRRLTPDEVLAEVDELRRSPKSVARYLAAIVGYLNEHGKEQVLRGAALISRVDGSVHESERRMLRRVGGVMGLEPTRTEAILGEMTRS